MDELRDYITALVERFRQQPVEWRQKVASLGPDTLHRVPPSQDWSAHQVIAHVMAADRKALQPRLNRIMTETEPELPNWDEEAWMAQSYSPDQPIEDELDSWQRERAELAAEFEELELADWNRTGWHPLRGQRTLLWWLEYAVGHVADHESQLTQIVSSFNKL